MLIITAHNVPEHGFSLTSIFPVLRQNGSHKKINDIALSIDFSDLTTNNILFTENINRMMVAED